MSQSIVPIHVRAHLIPFFYKEFQGKEVVYRNKKVKACQINMNSSIGFLLQVTLEKSAGPISNQKFNMFISVSNLDGKNTAEARLYKCVSGKYSFLKVPEKINERINDLLEDQFRIAFVYYVEGMLASNPDMLVKNAIGAFMEKYELDESGFELRALWRMLSREQKKDRRLGRMQNMSANRTLNYRS